MQVCIRLPLRLPKMQDPKSPTPHWLSSSGWGREGVSLVFEYTGGQYIRKGQWLTKVNFIRLAVGYLNATVDRTPRKLEPGIGTDVSSLTGQIPWVAGYRSEVGPQRESRWGVWMGLELNWTVLAVQTRTTCSIPGPIANTSHQPFSKSTKWSYIDMSYIIAFLLKLSMSVAHYIHSKKCSSRWQSDGVYQHQIVHTVRVMHWSR